MIVAILFCSLICSVCLGIAEVHQARAMAKLCSKRTVK